MYYQFAILHGGGGRSKQAIVKKNMYVMVCVVKNEWAKGKWLNVKCILQIENPTFSSMSSKPVRRRVS